LPALKDTLLPAAADDVLELDELWSFVLKKSRKRWLWTAICRRTRQIVDLVIGDRSQKTCRRLWNKIPDCPQDLVLFQVGRLPSHGHHMVHRRVQPGHITYYVTTTRLISLQK